MRQPWRLGAVYLSQAFGENFLEKDIPFVRHLDYQQWKVLARMITRGIQCPQTSSIGRLFDAVAALLGLRAYTLYEGQAAIELEGQAALLARQRSPGGNENFVAPYPFVLAANNSLIDVLPLIRAIVRDLEQGEAVPVIAWRFHVSIAELLAEISEKARRQTGLKKVVLSGGVFQNRLLLELLMARLERRAFQVYINRLVPPNDGGISLGQAAIAVARLRT